ncbi:MAG: hypothetical protein V1847_04425 [Candidatus Diapherotrites archaeon]
MAGRVFEAGSKQAPSKKEIPWEWVFGIAVFVAVLLVAVSFLWQPAQKFAFESAEGGVLFASNVQAPAELLKGRFVSSPNFVISMDFVQGNASNPQLGQAMILWTEVLTAQGKNVHLIVRMLDAEGNPTACQTNDANKYVNRAISLEECQAVLENTSNQIIFLHYPDSSLQQPKVVLDAHSARIFPKTASDSPNASFVMLKAMYADAETVLASINAAYSKYVQGGGL